LYEDGVPLGPRHSLHEDIRTLGGGRYAHWVHQLYFSTTDHSDPNTNGRSYQYSIPLRLFRRPADEPEVDPTLPVNHRKRDARPDQIAADVQYAIKVGKSYLTFIQSHLPSLIGKTVLEIGPGVNYGSIMLLAAHGAIPIVGDRFLAPWDRPYHPRFYAQLRDELVRSDPRADVRGLNALIEADSYLDSVVRRVISPVEQLPLPTGSVDVVLSNAVVEHLYDLEQSFAQLARVTRVGGLGFHQVDFRDHRNFDRPLEYLLLARDEFSTVFAGCHGECGNRYRPDETTACLQAAGFDVLDFTGNLFCKADYLTEFIPRLRGCRSPYRNRSEDDLRIISGRYLLRRRQ
jgi:SAM-dependent methyltransferase